MTNKGSGQAIGLMDTSFDNAKYEAPKPSKRKFLPWHRPRKHYVRKEQWQHQIEELANIGALEAQTLRYLGLPGTDLLDIRHFHKTLCVPKNLALYFLGFNNAAQSQHDDQIELNISLDEVRKMPRVDARSDVIQDDFCLLADDSSLAWSRVREYGPFNVVNIDLCNGFARHKPGTIDINYYNAIIRLMTLQAKQKQPWLLFLTTRTGKQDIHKDVLDILTDKYRSNLADCELFKEQSSIEFGIADEDELSKAVITPDGHLSVFLVALSKWMIGIGTVQQPPFAVTISSTLTYRIKHNAKHNDLVSIAFKFDPTFAAAPDPMGLAKVVDDLPTECKLASATVRHIKNRKCVDTILRDNPAIRSALVHETVELLKLARYDTSGFVDWLEAQ